MLMNKLLWIALTGIIIISAGCRYDMQDQPRYKSYKDMKDSGGSREPVEGTIAQGMLREDKALYTGKKEGITAAPAVTAIDASGNTVITTFPDAIDEFPIEITKETLDRGQQRYKIFCSVCHGPLGNADGMIVRRGFPKPPTYHDDRLRNAPVGHFFDVASNGWGRMNGYASQISVSDRWAIVAYIRALQASHPDFSGSKADAAAAPKALSSMPPAEMKLAANVNPPAKTENMNTPKGAANTAANMKPLNKPTEKGGNK